jgi:hypothetical protein
MTFKMTISADKLRSKPQWKSEQQFINEALYCAGLPFHQADLTNLYYGMQYKGSEPAPVQTRNPNGSVTVTWSGEVGEPRRLDAPKKRKIKVNPWMGA